MSVDIYTVLEWVVPIPIALLYANILEWGIHKFVLHALGRKKSNYWSFHWHTHHQQVRRNEHHDKDYEKPLFQWNARSKEILSLFNLAILHLPLAYFSPAFVLTLLYTNLNYYRVHKKSHLDPEWAKKHVPWHYDHHMGRNQDANWCVTKPWFDWIMGTRIPYIGTEEERLDNEKRMGKKTVEGVAC
jgi:hypothetical protein